MCVVVALAGFSLNPELRGFGTPLRARTRLVLRRGARSVHDPTNLPTCQPANQAANDDGDSNADDVKD